MNTYISKGDHSYIGKIYPLLPFIKKGATLVNLSLLPWIKKPFLNRVYSSRKEFAPLGANSSL